MNSCATRRDIALVLFLLDTGCRASEFVALNGDDVELSTGAVRIRKGKGRRHRTTFLGSGARKALLCYFAERGTPAPNEPIWIAERGGRRRTDSGLRQLLERIGKRSGVENCHPHTFRRTFALTSLRNGISIYHLQRLMGHADIDFLRTYLALDDEDLQVAHAQYGVVDSLSRR